MFGTKQRGVPRADDPEVGQYIAKTVGSTDAAVSSLLNEYHEAGWTVVAILPVPVSAFSSVQVVFSK